MKVAIANGQGGWLRQVSGPDERGCLGEVWTGADALREVGVPVQATLSPELESALEEAQGGMTQTRDERGRFA